MNFPISTSVQSPQALQQLKALFSLSAPARASTHLEPDVCPRTPVLKEDRAEKFRYWQNGHLHTGLVFSGDLFYAVVEFDLHSYSDGIKVADDLRNNGILTVITASERGLTVWVSLRSQPSLHHLNACDLTTEQSNANSTD